MQQDQTCQEICQTEAIPTEDAKFINKAIADGYAFNWAVDGLPAATEDVDANTGEKYYNIGFKLGNTYEGVSYLNNHYNIVIYYHITDRKLARVVGVVVKPTSRETKDDAKGDDKCTAEAGPFHLKEDGKSSVIYTYSVTWTVMCIIIIILLYSKQFFLNMHRLLILNGLRDGMVIFVF